MTTLFDSKKEALEMGLVYAGFENPEPRREILKQIINSKPEPVFIGWPQEKTVDLYRIKNSRGVDVGLGVGKIGDNYYDLWLINVTGEGCRRI